MWGIAQEQPHSEHRRIFDPRCRHHHEVLATRAAYQQVLMHTVLAHGGTLADLRRARFLSTVKYETV